MRLDTEGTATRDDEAMDVMGTCMSVVVRLGDAEDDTALIRSRMGAQPRQVPLHLHPDVEAFYVLEGRLDVFLNSDRAGWRTIEAGQSLTIPPGIPHAVRNASGAPVDSLIATTVRLARFLGEIATPPSATPGVPPSAEDIARVRAKVTEYGYWMATPDESAALLA